MYTLNYDTQQDKIFFFSNEQELFSIRENIRKGDVLLVRWCPTKIGDRIRGIKKYD